MTAQIFSASVLLLLVIDPFGNVPLVVSTLADVPAARRRAHHRCASACSRT